LPDTNVIGSVVVVVDGVGVATALVLDDALAAGLGPSAVLAAHLLNVHRVGSGSAGALGAGTTWAVAPTVGASAMDGSNIGAG